jgi:carboxypeptidase C (cathepsin A)
MNQTSLHRRLFALLVATVTTLGLTFHTGTGVFAQEAPAHGKSANEKADGNKGKDGEEDKAKNKEKESKERLVITEHQAVIAGQSIAYTATTGTLAMREDGGKTLAEMFFIAYTRPSAPGEPERPVTFCFNGGPGSSSVWLHMGMMGPKRVRLPDDATPLAPPYQLQDNPHSLLDVTDLVFIDPISTGYSRPAEGENKSQFHGYREDLESVGQFIHDYTTRFERWLSPKFVMGESYGGLRTAGLAGHLQDRYNLELNGVIFVSAVIDFETLRFGAGEDLPYLLFLPTYAATAWYHQALPADLQQESLESVVSQAEEFASNDYALALLAGSDLEPAQRAAVVERFSRLTGLSRDFVDGANLRVSMGEFGKELLRSRGRTIGRFDSRYLGRDRRRVGATPDYDPSGAAIFGPYTAVFNSYVRNQLNYKDDKVYEILTGNVQPWSYRSFENRYVDASESLRGAMTHNPYLKAFFACGYYDLATPHYAMDYTIRHLELAEELQSNITVHRYEGGHMMYVHEPSLVKLRSDLLQFYNAARPNQ